MSSFNHGIRKLFNFASVARQRRRKPRLASVAEAELCEARQMLSATTGNVMAIEVQAVGLSDGSPIHVGDQFKIQLVAKDLRNEPEGVFSAFADVEYSTGLADFFPTIDYVAQAGATTGSVDDSTGTVNEVGSVRYPILQELVIAEFTVTATEAGTLVIKTNEPEAGRSQNILHNGGQDVRDQTSYGELSIEIVEDLPAADVDGDGSFSFSSDGITLLAYSLGARGQQLEAYRGPGATRPGSEIESAIEQNETKFDVDGNGEFVFSNDGIILLAYSLGTRGDQLRNYAASDSPLTGDEIEARVEELIPRNKPQARKESASASSQSNQVDHEPEPQRSADQESVHVASIGHSMTGPQTRFAMAQDVGVQGQASRSPSTVPRHRNADEPRHDSGNLLAGQKTTASGDSPQSASSRRDEIPDFTDAEYDLAWSKYAF